MFTECTTKYFKVIGEYSSHFSCFALPKSLKGSGMETYEVRRTSDYHSSYCELSVLSYISLPTQTSDGSISTDDIHTMVVYRYVGARVVHHEVLNFTTCRFLFLSKARHISWPDPPTTKEGQTNLRSISGILFRRTTQECRESSCLKFLIHKIE